MNHILQSLTFRMRAKIGKKLAAHISPTLCLTTYLHACIEKTHSTLSQ